MHVNKWRDFKIKKSLQINKQKKMNEFILGPI